MDRSFINRLGSAIKEAEEILQQRDRDPYASWYRRISAYLSERDGQLEQALGSVDDSIDRAKWGASLERQIGTLEGAMHRAGESLSISGAWDTPGAAISGTSAARPSERVFVVHGHDTGWRESVARFVGRLGFGADHPP
jgi:hypothetical protein